MHYDEQREKHENNTQASVQLSKGMIELTLPLAPEQSPELKTSIDYLHDCIAVQSDRGKEYDQQGTGERSFAAAAQAFNAATGKNLTGSDVCLVLEMVKLVRQYSSPSRLHADSVLDKVSYSSLWAEELTRELADPEGGV